MKPAKKIILLTIVFFSVVQAGAQNNPEPVPLGGLQQLAYPYYNINFTVQQRESLSDKILQLYFEVNEDGSALLERVSGITDTEIIDSLYQVRSRPSFRPRVIDGVPEKSTYLLELEFPRHSESAGYNEEVMRRPRMSDFEYIDKSGHTLQFLITGNGNGFSGNASHYLRPGGGLRMDIVFGNSNGTGWGLGMGFSGNRLRRDYPVNTIFEQLDAPATILISLLWNKVFLEKDRYKFMLQLEPSYAAHSIEESDPNTGASGVSFSGFSPSITVHYRVQLGKERIGIGLIPSINTSALNIHAGIRPMFYNQRQASGLMIEAGIGYRWVADFVADYKYRD